MCVPCGRIKTACFKKWQLCDHTSQAVVPVCRPDCILVLDTWFMLVVHYGKTIVEWRKAGYHLQPDQDGFR